jgi:alkylated DNA repair protein alkB family protein 1
MTSAELQSNQITISHIADIRTPSGPLLQCFKFAWPEGLCVIKNYVPPLQQLKICQEAMNDWVSAPHRTNLHIYSESYTDPTKPKNYDEMMKKLISDDSQFYFHKAIRWTNIGKQYDWPNRCYLTPAAPLLPTLQTLGTDGVNQFELQDYNPEAVICNFYDKRDHMGGHLDDGEPDQLHPIISYSFGLSCVFLVGGRKKTVKPHALCLDSGDLLIMSREARLCYHGVPRVLEGSFCRAKFEEALDLECPGWEGEGVGEGEGVRNSWDLPENRYRHVLRYLEGNRVNINIRQVFLKGEEEGGGGEKGLGSKKGSCDLEMGDDVDPPAGKKIKLDGD